MRGEGGNVASKAKKTQTIKGKKGNCKQKNNLRGWGNSPWGRGRGKPSQRGRKLSVEGGGGKAALGKKKSKSDRKKVTCKD